MIMAPTKENMFSLSRFGTYFGRFEQDRRNDRARLYANATDAPTRNWSRSMVGASKACI